MIYLTRNTDTVPLKYLSLVGAKPYSPYINYGIDDLVSQGYRCIAPVLGVAPPNLLYWVPAVERYIKVNATLDSSGIDMSAGTVEPVYIYVNSLNNQGDDIVTSYTQIQLQLTNIDQDIIWEMSIDNVNFVTTLAIPDLLILPAFLEVYIKATIVNNGKLKTGTYVSPTITLTYAEG